MLSILILINVVTSLLAGEPGPLPVSSSRPENLFESSDPADESRARLAVGVLVNRVFEPLPRIRNVEDDLPNSELALI